MPGWLSKILGFLPGGFGDIAGIIGSVINYKQQERANETNLQMVRMQNQAAAQESEKAYQRSRASSQVADMMSAGMSKAGALNAINGGGSYTPAPVNAGQVQAPQMDLSNAFSGILQTAENAKQRNMQERIAEEQIKAQQDAQKAQFEENEKQRKHDLEMQSREHTNTNRNADNRLNYDKQYFNEVLLPESRERINEIKENTRFTREQRKHFEDLRPILKQNAEEEVNKLKEEVKSITSLRNLDVRRFALEKLKVHIESYFGVGIHELRNTLSYWEERPEILYKGMGWRSDALTELDSKEDELFDYINKLNELLDEIDKLEAN